VTCREFTDFIMSYLDGELSNDVRAPFERHLERCPGCNEYLRQYTDTIRAGKRAFDCSDDAVPDDVPEELVQAILAARKGL
jgi:anti-sigma factor RsiW